MALFDLFKHKRKETTKRPTPKAVEEAPVESKPTIAAPVSPILRSFHISEKATRGMAYNQFTFMVDAHATKTQIRDAVARSYKVDVIDVQTVRLPGKDRTVGRHMGHVPARRKAVVTLKEGQTIAAAQP